MTVSKVVGAFICVGISLLPAAQAGSWTGSERLDRARSGLAATPVGDLIYVGGGAAAGDPANSFEVFDTARESWQPLPSLPMGLISFSMAAIGNQIFVAGGYSADDPGEPHKEVWAYDTQAAAWKQKASMPTARAAHAMVAVGGKLYVVGGSGKEPGKVLVYDPGTDAWRSAAALPKPRRALHLQPMAGRYLPLAASHPTEAFRGRSTPSIRPADHGPPSRQCRRLAAP